MLFNRLWISVVVCIFVLSAYSKEMEISISNIILDNLSSNTDVHYVQLTPPFSSPQISVSLWGHIYSPDDRSTFPLTSPWLSVEEKNSNGEWIEVAAAVSTVRKSDVARIQNLPIEGHKSYRFVVRTKSFRGGRYSLIVDPSYPGYEFEVEELDIGTAPNGEDFTIACGFVAANPNDTNTPRVVIGTEQGYVLMSDDSTSWRTIYPLAGEKPFPEPLFSVFVDSQGNMYASPWTPNYRVEDDDLHGLVVESRDGGKTWQKVADTEWPTGVAWRWAEDSLGNVFFGEYSGFMPTFPPPYHGNVWRRQNFGNSGDKFEIVFANPNDNNDTNANHVHYVGVDPYTDVVYAAIGDGGTGRFTRSFSHGYPGTWVTLERGVDSQYTLVTYTPDYLYLGTDTNKMHKKLIRWDKTSPAVYGNEMYWTSDGMDHYPNPPRMWTDKGNWFWAHYFEPKHTIVANYMPYNLAPMDNGQMQPPRIYATNNNGDFWWRAITLPPGPIRTTQLFGETGPKMSSNLRGNNWVYASRGSTGMIHRGFRFRMKLNLSQAPQGWEMYK